MNFRRVRFVISVLALWAAFCGSAGAQLITGGDSVIDQLNPFHPFDPSQPVTVSELCKRLDCVAEELRDDGLVVVKEPDVFSQARMTRFRNDFENQMSTDLGNFHLVLAARINRLDAATTTSTTALSAALSAPGSTQVSQPTTPTFMDTSKLFPTPTATVVSPTTGPLSNIALANQGYGTSASSAAALGLGVDPTVYLDEKKRFLEHLNQIRRINLGPDQNDSSGYGLYLVRLPVSITPGECTYHGYGAELSVSVEHEFTDQFLPTTFRNLVVNDLVDQLGPFIYGIIRSGFYDDLETIVKTKHKARQKRQALAFRSEVLINSLMNNFAQRIVNAVNAGAPAALPLANHTGQSGSDPADPLALPLQEFVLHPLNGLTGDPDNDRASSISSPSGSPSSPMLGYRSRVGTRRWTPPSPGESPGSERRWKLSDEASPQTALSNRSSSNSYGMSCQTPGLATSQIWRCYARSFNASTRPLCRPTSKFSMNCSKFPPPTGLRLPASWLRTMTSFERLSITVSIT